MPGSAALADCVMDDYRSWMKNRVRTALGALVVAVALVTLMLAGAAMAGPGEPGRAARAPYSHTP
jgi:hypothetical protein